MFSIHRFNSKRTKEFMLAKWTIAFMGDDITQAKITTSLGLRMQILDFIMN